MKKLNVLQVTPALGGQGGVERGTVEMAKYLVQRGAGSYVAARHGPLAEQLAREGSTHIDLPLDRRNPITILRNAFRLARVIRRRQIAVVHARSRAPAWSALWACKLTGVPMVTTFHGIYGRQNFLKHLYNSVMTRGLRTIAVSEFVKQHILDQYGVPEAKITVAKRGFDATQFDAGRLADEEVEKLRTAWGVAPSTTVFLSLGRITRLKGHAMMFEALANVKSDDWFAVVVGGAGKKQDYLRELRELLGELGLSDRVLFAGVQSNVPLYYAAADVAVCSSIETETFGRVAVEAQAMGKPVIATAHGGFLETVQHGVTGLLVDPQAPTEMTAAFEQLLAMSPAERAAMGTEARRWVTQNFSVEKMCEAEFSAYEQILGLGDSP